MRTLLTLAVVASLAACTRQAENEMGRAPPETGRIAPADTLNAPPMGGAGTDTGMTPRHLPDSSHQMRRDST